MTTFNRHDVTGVTNQGIDQAMKVEVHPNAHSSLLNIHSSDRLSNTTYADAQYTIGGLIMESKVNKVALSEYRFRYCIPNINKRNDTISFLSSNTGAVVHTTVLVTNHYNIPDLMAHLETQLNLLTGASGLTFTVTEVFDCNYSVEAGGGTFRFVSSTHVDRASPCTGIFATAGLISGMDVVVGGQYTSYLDITMDQMRDAQIIQNSFTKDNIFAVIDHIYRVPVTQTPDNVFEDMNILIKNLNYIAIRNKDISNLRVKIYDQFGELIYSPVELLASEIFNIPLIKYSIKFSMSA